MSGPPAREAVYGQLEMAATKLQVLWTGAFFSKRGVTMRQFTILLLWLSVSVVSLGQKQATDTANKQSLPVTTQATNPNAVKPLPFEKQLRKTVAFIHSWCVESGQSKEFLGTGFWLSYPVASSNVPGLNFNYLVTNRHVAECWNENRNPRPVQSVNVRINLKDGSSQLLSLGNPAWVFPTDSSVDLAIFSIGLDPETVDFLSVPSTNLVREEELSEGERIILSGFFIQFPGVKHMEPIVREGVLAMLPDEDMTTTAGKPGRVYLGDVHIFGGNSGSPVFVDVGSSHLGMIAGPEYKMLGVVSGMFYEDSNFSLQVTTMVEGVQHGNSGIAMIVPAHSLSELLENPLLVTDREAGIARWKKEHPTQTK